MNEEKYTGENPYDLVVTLVGEVLQPMDCPLCAGHPGFTIPNLGIPGFSMTNQTPIDMIVQSVVVNGRDFVLSDLRGCENERPRFPSGGNFSLSESALASYSFPRLPDFGSIDITLRPADPSALDGLVHSMKMALQPFFTSINLSGGSLDSIGKKLDTLVRTNLCDLRITYATAGFWELQEKGRKEVEEFFRAHGSYFPSRLAAIVIQDAFRAVGEDRESEAQPRVGWSNPNLDDSFNA